MSRSFKDRTIAGSPSASNSRNAGPGEQDSPRFMRSASFYREAQKYMPGGVNSNFRLGMKPLPLFFERASGSRISDADGNEYVDYALGMGPVILGHAHPAVTEAVRAGLDRGQLYAGQHELELALAREICESMPCAEMIRFSLSGSEATQAALRLARAFTGRKKIIKFEGHYHGWMDNIYVSVHADGRPSKPGQPVAGSAGQDENAYAQTQVLPWNDPAVFRKTVGRDAGEVAAVIMEPIMCNTSVIVPRLGYLEEVRQICTRHGIVLIFDEVITGFRVGLGGAQELLSVTPDLAVFAKAVANGYPLSGLAGRRDIMELFASKSVMHGGTYNANTLSCAAGLATVRQLRKTGDALYARMNELGHKLMRGLERVGRQTGEPLHVQGLGAVFHCGFTDQPTITSYNAYLRCDLPRQARFVHELLQEGVIVTSRGTWFLSAAHSDADIEFTLSSAARALRALRRGTATRVQVKPYGHSRD